MIGRMDEFILLASVSTWSGVSRVWISGMRQRFLTGVQSSAENIYIGCQRGVQWRVLLVHVIVFLTHCGDKVS